MSRAMQTASLAVAVASIYLAIFLKYIPVSERIYSEIIPLLPFWTAVSFGALLLFQLGYGVMTFNDVPEAHEELMAQVKQAKIELRRKGVTVDDVEIKQENKGTTS